MATTTISVNKQTIKQLLESGKTQQFLIPEYQRPYSWTEDEIITLFDDLREFAGKMVDKSESQNGVNSEEQYFLGTIVSFINEQKQQEIIDGQQRITSLLLLLRAIYTKLKTAKIKTPKDDNFIKKIEPAIWIEDKYTGEVDYSKALITSDVLGDVGNNVFKDILASGTADALARDNYSKNYLLFQKLYDELCQDNPLFVYDFIYNILNNVIVLPIQADTQDTALTIFSTLNNRGMPLSDADIFKVKMYDQFDAEEKQTFIKDWKNLDIRSTDTDETIQHLFYYYMYYMRAREGNYDSTIPGARKYFSENKYSRLNNTNLLSQLDKILNLWAVVNKHDNIDGESWSTNTEIIKILDMLSAYPNEFWKYPVVVYYLTYRNDNNFNQEFLIFLHKLFAEIAQRYIVTPTINAVKTAIIKLNTYIIKTPHPAFEFKAINEMELINNIKKPQNKHIIRMLLKTLAYCESSQTEILPDKWEIEHILPQHWQASYFKKDFSDEKISELINEIGNLTPFEKKLNIVAGDGYFEKKKLSYADSKIAITKNLTKMSNWMPDDIFSRNDKLADGLLAKFKLWTEEYDKQ